MAFFDNAFASGPVMRAGQGPLAGPQLRESLSNSPAQAVFSDPIVLAVFALELLVLAICSLSGENYSKNDPDCFRG